MIKNLMIGTVLAGALATAPFALNASTTQADAACACCGDSCSCENCRCDAAGCVCYDGGPCACEAACCTTCCDD
ncbi:hypothetical protein [Crateriforma spongiae]|uniref:hypothetical protein n=1 Tax=Crateriforma spongiae TaxID=2724528 RepID=UPI0039AFDC32